MAAEETSEALIRLQEQVNSLNQLLDKTKESFGTQNASMSKAEAQAKLTKQAANSLAKSFVDGASAMYRGEKGMNAFNKSIDHGADALIQLAAKLALIGGPLTLLAAGFTAVVAGAAKYVKASNEQSAALYKAYQGIAQAGAAGSDGLQGIYTDMQKLGLDIKDLDKMVAMVNANSKDLALLGGSVRQGRQEFANISKSMDAYRVQMYNLGMSQEQLNEGTLSYIRTQQRSGGTFNKTTEELADGARKYLIEQDALTKLTGQTREQQEKAREEYLSQERFAATIYEMRKANKEKEAEQLMNYVTTLGTYNKVAAMGVADAASGNLQTKAAQQGARATNMEQMRIIEGLKSGQLDAAQALDRDTAARKEFIDTIGTQQAKMGNFGDAYGSFQGTIEQIVASEKGSFAERLAAIQKDQAAQKAGADKETQINSEMLRTQIQTAQKMQDFTRVGVIPATQATAAFGKALDYVTGKILPGAGSAGKVQSPVGAAVQGAIGGAPGARSEVGTAISAARGGAAPGAGEGTTTGGPMQGPKLSRISSRGGPSAMVNSEYAPQFQQLVDYLDGVGYKIYSLGGYVDRDVRGQPGVKSVHAKGGAIDINPANNPYGSSLITDMPPEIGAVAKSLGLGWGGNWTSIKDAMHFSVAQNEGGTIKLRDGGIATGPEDGYPATLHGKEAVIPLNQGSGADFMNSLNNMGLVSEQMLMVLQDIAQIQRNAVSISEKMLRAAQN